MYAIVQTGGKQYKVEQGDQILVEKLDAEVGSEVCFETLLVSDDAGIKVGQPVLDGVAVKVGDQLRRIEDLLRVILFSIKFDILNAVNGKSMTVALDDFLALLHKALRVV